MPEIGEKLVVYLAVVGAGGCVALQQVLNARLRAELASLWWAGFFSYAVGTTVMLVAVCVFGEPRLTSAVFARVSWISWTGGLFGALFIATAILTVPRLGAATVMALVVVGQMSGSMVFDQIGLLGLAPQPVTPMRVAGGVMLVLGVVCLRS